MSNLTEDLRQWRADRNITKADYFVFVEKNFSKIKLLLEKLSLATTVVEYEKV